MNRCIVLQLHIIQSCVQEQLKEELLEAQERVASLQTQCEGLETQAANSERLTTSGTSIAIDMECAECDRMQQQMLSSRQQVVRIRAPYGQGPLLSFFSSQSGFCASESYEYQRSTVITELVLISPANISNTYLPLLRELSVLWYLVCRQMLEIASYKHSEKTRKLRFR